jgi:phage terminase Nu1 subunit (DNA packaging protein)
MDDTLSKQEICRLLKLSTKRIETLTTEGMPVVMSGRHPRYPVPNAVLWYIARKEQAASDRSAPADLDEARARREAALAEQEELKLGQLRRELMTVADYDRAVGGTLSRVDGRLKSLPQRIAATQWPADYAERLEMARGLVEEVRGEIRPEAAA